MGVTFGVRTFGVTYFFFFTDSRSQEPKQAEILMLLLFWDL